MTAFVIKCKENQLFTNICGLFYRGLVPPSEQEYPILGLNLLRLLVQNRIAEFHTGARTSLLPVFVLITIFCIVMTSYNYRVLRFTGNAIS
jgi:hypothetical protein